MDVKDSSKNYPEESYYTLNGELSEIWIYKDHKAIKVAKKSLQTSYNGSKGIVSRTCTTLSWQESYSYGYGGYDNITIAYAYYTVYLEVCTDDETLLASPSDFGGGGGGPDPVPPPPLPPSPDPCATAKVLSTIASNQIISKENSQILANTNPSAHEWGAEQVLQSLPTTLSNNYDYRSIDVFTNGPLFTPRFFWDNVDGYTIGVAHSHPDGSAPSPQDVVWMYNNLNSIPNADLPFYQNNVSVTVITTNGTFVVTPQNWSSLKSLYNNFIADPTSINTSYLQYQHDYFVNNPNADLATASAYALLAVFGDAITLSKAPAGSTDFSPLQSNATNQISQNPCH